ncbi:MAG TPA: dihydrolipoamide acetyltransferase family protein [Anaerolineaceae bacterium]|nr:dihydrolipoamide acetyltransferase family protein [Anaerolineaceae bacterium]
MPIDVVMPKLGLNMSEGLLVEWLKKEGDPVKRGESLFTVETDKVTTESVAQVDGVLGKILVEAGATVPVRTVVGLILADGEKFNPDEVAAPAMAQAVIEQKPADAKQIPNNMPSIARSRKILATPLAKRLATENALDLASIQGTGPDGRIGQEDVERAVSKLQAAPTPAIMTPSASQQQILPIDGVRALIAERMTHSMQSSAQLTLHSEIDASGLVNYRQRIKAASNDPAAVPSYNAILVFLVARALHENPRLNARQVSQTIHLLSEIHVGLAVDTEAGLVVVVVRDADRKSIADIHKELGILTESALSRKSQPDDLSGSTFTITNLGSFGIDSFTPILNPPEVGILGVGRITEKLVIQDSKVAQHPVTTLSLTIDHRLVDGAPAARFLQTLATNIAELA